MGFTLSAVRKRYVAPDGTWLDVLDVPSFAVEKGEQVALVGSSGSGKTTLLHTIAGIVTPDSGQVVHVTADETVDIATLPEPLRDRFRGSHIGYIFQTHHLLPGFTALENVMLGMSFTGRAADPKWGERLLREVGLGDRLHYRPAKMSVGQQQRVAVARALANRPALVLADEPTGALDHVNAGQVLGLIRSLCTEIGASLVIVTHDRVIASEFDRSVDLATINRAAMAPPPPPPPPPPETTPSTTIGGRA